MTAPHSTTDPAGFGVLVIGDELLSGKRRDGHMGKVIELLTSRGLELAWARFLGDDPKRLTEALRQTVSGDDAVFSFGGIGGTPDDRTRQCAAEALGRPLEAHPEGLAELRAQFGDEGTPRRRAMVEFPAGATLIPNPVNRVPGFTCGHHHFVPGFPNMAWPMVEWVLDHHYAHLHATGTRTERALTVRGLRESSATPFLEELTARHPAVRISCLPRWCPPEFELELGVRGHHAEVDAVIDAMQRYLHEREVEWSEKPL